MRNCYSLMLLAAMLISSCTKDKNNGAEETKVETKLPEKSGEVTVMKLIPTDFNHELLSNGKLTARRLADLRFQTVETIAHIWVKNGDRVKKGDKLAELDRYRLTNKTIQAKDALERAKLELQDVLIGQGYAPEDTTRIPASIMKLARVKSGYDQSLTMFRMAEYEERNATLKAPIDGVVANLFAREHNLAPADKMFCTIIDPGSLEASFSVLEGELSLITKGDKVEVTPFAQAASPVTGRITEINPLVDADGMVQVRAAVGADNKLFEGMNVRVSVHRSVANQLVVPKTAIVLRSGKQVLFTKVGGKAMWNYVTTHLENATEYALTGETINAGDTVITTGNINLAHQSPVHVVKEQ